MSHQTDYLTMKLFVLTFLIVLSAGSTVAQGLRREAVNGAVIGGVAGAIIGHNSGGLRHNAWRGAALGAGAGLLIGQAVGDHRDHRGYRHDRHSGHRHSSARYSYWEPTWGYNYGEYGRHGYGRDHGAYDYYGSPSYSYVGPDYGYSSYGYDTGYSGRPNYATRGLWWGALAGAVIGNNSGDLHHNAWRGAGYGAAAGYLFGSIAENRARRREAAASERVTLAESATDVAVTSPAPIVTPRGSSVTVSVERSSSAMSSANALFGR